MDFLQLGQYLRETRENSERTVEEASQELRIRQSHLEAFERGDFASFPDGAPIRGFLRNYATWLGLDEERTIAYYEEAANPDKSKRKKRKTQEVSQIAVAPRRITDTPRSLPPVELAEYRAQRSRNLLFAAFLVIASVISLIVIAFVTVEIVRAPQDDFVATSPPRTGLGVLPPTTTFTPSWTPRPIIATPTPSPVFTGRGVLVEVTITQRTYLRVIVDGGEQFAGIARPDDTLRYDALNSVNLTAGNAAALEIIHNGRVQPGFGVRGQRVEITFTSDDVAITTGPGMEPTPLESATPIPPPDSVAATAILALTPTEGPSPTPTFTPTITPTPPPTDTPVLTDTPTSTPTDTPVPSITPPPSLTPSLTPTPTITLTFTPTAVLPARATPEGLPPTKVGG